MHGLKIPVNELYDTKQSGIHDVQVEFRSGSSKVIARRGEERSKAIQAS